jgi:hypothetical protein
VLARERACRYTRTMGLCRGLASAFALLTLLGCPAETDTSAGGSPPTGPECEEDADCPKGECESAACASGSCTTAPLEQGIVVDIQQAGDCLNKVCDGAGSTEQVPNMEDTPAQGGTCVTYSCGPSGLEFVFNNGVICAENEERYCIENPQNDDPDNYECVGARRLTATPPSVASKGATARQRRAATASSMAPRRQKTAGPGAERQRCRLPQATTVDNIAKRSHSRQLKSATVETGGILPTRLCSREMSGGGGAAASRCTAGVVRPVSTRRRGCMGALLTPAQALSGSVPIAATTPSRRPPRDVAKRARRTSRSSDHNAPACGVLRHRRSANTRLIMRELVALGRKTDAYRGAGGGRGGGEPPSRTRKCAAAESTARAEAAG